MWSKDEKNIEKSWACETAGAERDSPVDQPGGYSRVEYFAMMRRIHRVAQRTL